MDVLELLKSKQIDIYISLFMTIFGLVLGIIIDLIRKNGSNSIRNNCNINDITINNIYQSENKYTSQKNEDAVVLFYFVLFLLGTIYLFFRVEILNVFYYLTIFLISILSTNILLNLLKRNFSGFNWVINIIFNMLFFIGIFFIINKALIPDYAPEYFSDAQQIVNQNGLLGLKNYFTLQDLFWFLIHLFGIVFLFLAMLRLIFFTTFYTIMGNHLLSANYYNKPWIAKKTKKYSNLWKNIFVVFFLLITSYYLVSGNFYLWYNYKFPEQSTMIINKIFNGE
ncbi:hypothetical protein N5915_03410 [Arcobacter lacus]|uniref:hypothetical protein n=1 Tax=Arcobacter lacus TaxID=1912876 RepID=UPI0021BBA097|nr:hypothetical protein [Arcobacter lacus]MCT7908596.1 hypothetical protein [Arcobacter lacus]